MKKSLEKSETERESTSKFLTQLKEENIIGSNVFMTAFQNIINQMADLEHEVPRVKSHIAGFIAKAIVDDVIELKDAYELIGGAQKYPLFLLCLQQLTQSKDEEWIFEKFTDSKINLMLTLPEIDRRKERLADILRDRGLGFLCPLLRIESDLWRQINLADCTPSVLYRWIKDNASSNLQNTTGFVNILFTCISKFITEKAKQLASEATFNEGDGNTVSTNVADHEKDLMTKYRAIFHAFLNEKPDLQLVALYSLQSYCHDLDFPKGKRILNLSICFQYCNF